MPDGCIVTGCGLCQTVLVRLQPRPLKNKKVRTSRSPNCPILSLGATEGDASKPDSFSWLLDAVNARLFWFDPSSTHCPVGVLGDESLMSESSGKEYHHVGTISQHGGCTTSPAET